MHISALLREYIAQTLKTIGITVSSEHINLEHPGDLSHGDYSTNIALVLAKEQKMNPKVLAEKICGAMVNPPEEISRIFNDMPSVAGPGFINFYLANSFFVDVVKKIKATGPDYGKSERYNNKKILVEHSSPNLFKPFHIGHVMNNAIGESIARLAKFSGAKVTTIAYPSDVSLGIGKAVWAMLQDGLTKLDSYKTDVEKIAYLGECYVRGTKAMGADPSLEPAIRAITKKLYEQTPSLEWDAYTLGKNINLVYFKDITKRIGSAFDGFIFESEAGKEGQKIVTDNIGKVFTESEGAVIYEGEKDGLHTRVFINKEGYPTYEAKDIGLMSLKFSRYNPDVSLFVTDHEQSEYFKVVSTAAGKINPTWKEKTIHRTHGRMSFKGQKMSSRLGGVPIAATLIDTVVDEVKEKNPETTNESADSIAISAIKFSILRAMAGKNINFDPETSLSFEGGSGPYLQYVYVRAQSLLEKAKGLGYGASLKDIDVIPGTIERYLDRFPEVVDQCISLWEPHHMATYLLELAQAFNTWYAGTKVIDENNKDKGYQLALVEVTAQTIKKGLDLLGISVPDKM